MRPFARQLRAAAPLQRTLASPSTPAAPRPLARSYASSCPQASRPTTTAPRRQPLLAARSLHTSRSLSKKKEEHTPTSFQDLDVLGNTPIPSTSVDVCMWDGFGLNSGHTISDGDGALLVDGEAFAWRPWALSGEMRVQNDKGQFDVPTEAFSVFDVLWPRPDLLIIGTGPSIVPLSPALKKHISSLGMRLEVLDTRNAASQFNMLATERGVTDVAAVLVPIGWKEGVGAVE